MNDKEKTQIIVNATTEIFVSLVPLFESGKLAIAGKEGHFDAGKFALIIQGIHKVIAGVINEYSQKN